MYGLTQVYSMEAYQHFDSERTKQPSDQLDLKRYRRHWRAIDQQPAWIARSYQELFSRVAFLSVMNKRLALYFRGQDRDSETVVASMYRSQLVFGDCKVTSSRDRVASAFETLEVLAQRVYDLLLHPKNGGIPRFRGIRDHQETRWSIIQHYEQWPTPLLDITSSLRVAATFALRDRTEGYLYVFGLPYSNGSITIDVDDNILLARLSATCPPTATRPHWQEGYLVSTFPRSSGHDERADRTNLKHRLVAKFKLENHDRLFWPKEYPSLEPVLVTSPESDPFHRNLQEGLRAELAKGMQKLEAIPV
jgi:hypothetical protein